MMITRAGFNKVVESKNIHFAQLWCICPGGTRYFEDLGRALDEGEVSGQKVVKITSVSRWKRQPRVTMRL